MCGCWRLKHGHGWNHEVFEKRIISSMCTCLRFHLRRIDLASNKGLVCTYGGGISPARSTGQRITSETYHCSCEIIAIPSMAMLH